MSWASWLSKCASSALTPTIISSVKLTVCREQWFFLVSVFFLSLSLLLSSLRCSPFTTCELNPHRPVWSKCSNPVLVSRLPFCKAEPRSRICCSQAELLDGECAYVSDSVLTGVQAWRNKLDHNIAKSVRRRERVASSREMITSWKWCMWYLLETVARQQLDRYLLLDSSVI